MNYPYNILKDERPWGDFQQFCHNQEVTVKIITVKSGEQLSVQLHLYRDELWVPLDPGLVALVGDETTILNSYKRDLIYIPRKTKHSMKNTSVIESARFLEVAFGHFDEEDIERFEDRYGRI